MSDLRTLGKAMRDAQRAYNAERSHENGKRMMAAVDAFDKALSEPSAAREERLYSALWQAAPHVCSLLCPSVKKTAESWTHVPLCEEITAALYPPVKQPRHAPLSEPPAALAGEYDELVKRLYRMSDMTSTDNDLQDIARAADAITTQQAQLRDANDALAVTDGHYAELKARVAQLEAAAQAIIAQWDTPNWKLTEPTGKLIAALRAALFRTEAKAQGGDNE